MYLTSAGSSATFITLRLPVGGHRRLDCGVSLNPWRRCTLEGGWGSNTYLEQAFRTRRSNRLRAHPCQKLPSVSLRFSDELPRSSETLVVGAGVVGVWVALLSLRGIDCEFGALDAAGDQVTLLDAWGCAHPRATSADETRILHLAHGADPLLTNWAWRARERWLAVERETSVSLFSRTG